MGAKAENPPQLCQPRVRAEQGIRRAKVAQRSTSSTGHMHSAHPHLPLPQMGTPGSPRQVFMAPLALGSGSHQLWLVFLACFKHQSLAGCAYSPVGLTSWLYPPLRAASGIEALLAAKFYANNWGSGSEPGIPGWPWRCSKSI